MAGRALGPAELVELVPQRPPFRFLDAIDAVDEARIQGRYRFRPDEPFYAGHFPGNPITPGVILIETMAQTGVVAHGIYLHGLTHDVEEVRRLVSVFTDGQVEFQAPVLPGEEVTVRSEVVFFRRLKIRSRIELVKPDGRVAATATLAGMGVERA
jgi:3-hydroxyacyl-[acyl-carrier-protein] dehydratase